MTESDLATLVDELREAVRARDEFLAIAAHELRNPMHALLLSVTSTLKAARRQGDPELVHRLERLMLTVQRYIQRADLLLDISRMNVGQFSLKPKDVDFSGIVANVLESYSIEAEFHQVELRREVPDALIGHWDPVALEQIVANLISNAVKYGAGSVVDVTLLLEAPATARLTVQDRGIGISEQDQARVFGRFEQVVTGSSRSGFGLGLWLVRSLVEAHGGTIAIESTLNEGSVFTVRLPIHPNRSGA